MAPETRSTRCSAGERAAYTSSRCAASTSAVRFSAPLKELTTLARTASRLVSWPASAALPTLLPAAPRGSFQYPPSQSISLPAPSFPWQWGHTLGSHSAWSLVPHRAQNHSSCSGLRMANATRRVPSNCSPDAPPSATGREWQQASARKQGYSLDHQCKHCSSKSPEGSCCRASSSRRASKASSSAPWGGESSCCRAPSSWPASATTTPAPRFRLQSLSTTASPSWTAKSFRIVAAKSCSYCRG
mmetsp:Transcript_118090/g.367899  ORF Transcript_118090/g.367899 Transcript_118090/m.367899 type:complete len:244 (+) Transcript_118090:822-1553(+)